jgi:hypothetical protein
LVEEKCADVVVEAKDEEQAELKATLSGDKEWTVPEVHDRIPASKILS